MPARLTAAAALCLTLLVGAAVDGGSPAVAASTPGAAPPPSHADRRPFQGLGTWVDGYDFSRELTSNPSVTAAGVQTMKDRGVGTIWLQAAKQSSATPGALLSPDRLGAFLTTAHAKGLRVIAWYLPTFADPAADWRHLSAMVDFTARGQHFDAYGVDIEDTRVAVGPRNSRLVALSQRLRRYTSRPVSAVVLPPVLTEIIHPDYWGGEFPWSALRSSYDVWVPMGYYTAYGRYPRWRDAAASTAEDLRRVKGHLGAVPVAYAGGLAGESSAADDEGFSRAARAAGALGTSAYDYATTPASAWSHLRAGAPRP